ERVYIVEVVLPVAVIDEILDAADVEPRTLRDGFDLLDDVSRRLVAFDAKTGLGRVDGAGATYELHAVRRLARVGGTQIERADGRIDLDRVQVFSAERLDADDVAVAERCGFLHERNAVNAELDFAARDRAGERRLGLIANDASAAAADVGFDEHRVAQPGSSGRGERRMVDRARLWVRKAKLLEQIELRRL